MTYILHCFEQLNGSVWQSLQTTQAGKKDEEKPKIKSIIRISGESVYSLIFLMDRNTVNSPLMDTSIRRTPCVCPCSFPVIFL